MDNSPRGEALASFYTVRKSQRDDPRAMDRVIRRDRFDTMLLRPVQNLESERIGVRCDPCGPELEEQVERRVQPRELLERQRDELELPRVIAPGEVVVHELREIVRSANAHPAHEPGMKIRDQLA